jgi:glycosyltransferase involved in cell wall biosynthesis
MSIDFKTHSADMTCVSSMEGVQSRSGIEADRQSGQEVLKICVWTPIPNHYQRAFVMALSEQCDLRVIYFARVSPARIALGWDSQPSLSENEFSCSTLDEALRCIPDWKNRFHVVPGYGGSFQRDLARHLSAHGIPWVDWSESSSPGFRWYARLPVKLWWTRMVSRFAIGSLAIGSQAEDDFARRGIKRSNIAYLPYVCAVSDESVEPDTDTLQLKAGRQAFLFLGMLTQRKGIDILLRAAQRVLPKFPDWVLMLVGNDTKDRRYGRMAERLGMASQVIFLGPVHPSRIRRIVASANVLVLPSRYDGWGLAINEGVAGGLAIIASHRCGAARHLVIPGHNGFRVKGGSESELATALAYYTASPDLARQHGIASRLLAHDISPDLNARRMLSAISFWMAARRNEVAGR